MKIKGIGIDITKNSRFNNKALVNRFLSPMEKTYFSKLSSHEQIQFSASCWAGKEAIIKATNKKYGLKTISILRDNCGAPKIFINEIHEKRIMLSIAHEKEYTVAYVIYLDKV
ncbi:MAG: 4'-phosphopantetheinyl transferase superfamily protein [Mycoplasmataceae bacterium]|nr:4'-phosphopantetheinyl transferase superfamily protein [Mycoplasmataceae bacterium]